MRNQAHEFYGYEVKIPDEIKESGVISIFVPNKNVKAESRSKELADIPVLPLEQIGAQCRQRIYFEPSTKDLFKKK